MVPLKPMAPRPAGPWQTQQVVNARHLNGADPEKGPQRIAREKGANDGEKARTLFGWLLTVNGNPSEEKKQPQQGLWVVQNGGGDPGHHSTGNHDHLASG